MKYLNYNANPYGVRTNDCVTRALVAATRYGYKTISEMLGLKLFKGKGVDSVTYNRVQDFAKTYGIIRSFDYELDPNWKFTQRDMVNFSRYGGMTMGFWMEHLSKEITGGSNILFLVKLKPDEAIPGGNTTRFHAIWGNVTTKEYADLEDTKDSIVFDMFSVDPTKMCKKDDPRYYLTEAKQLKDENREYLNKIFKRKVNESLKCVNGCVENYKYIFDSEQIDENELVDKFIEQVTSILSLLVCFWHFYTMFSVLKYWV